MNPSKKYFPALATLLFLASEAEAGCNTKDMQGTWAVQALTSVMGNQLLSCQIIIQSESGKSVVDPKTSCLLKYNQSALTKTALGGTASISRDCKFSISVDVDPKGYIILEGDLAKNKQVGNARFNTNQLPENALNNGYLNYWGIASLIRK